MLKIIFFISVSVFAILFIILAIILRHRHPKTNIYEFSIRNNSNIDFKSLKLVISTYFGGGLKIIVIQDDIDFKSSKFYWPKHSIYLHMSDAQKISSEQFVSTLFLEPFEKNLSYLKNVIYIR